MRLVKPNVKAEKLGRVPLFSSCTPRELARLAKIVDEIAVRRGGVVCHEGERGRQLMVIASGRASSSSADGTSAMLGPGDLLAESAVFDGGLSPATVTALTAMRLYVVDERHLGSFVAAAPILSLRLMRHLASRRDGTRTAVVAYT